MFLQNVRYVLRKQNRNAQIVGIFRFGDPVARLDVMAALPDRAVVEAHKRNNAQQLVNRLKGSGDDYCEWALFPLRGGRRRMQDDHDNGNKAMRKLKHSLGRIATVIFGRDFDEIKFVLSGSQDSVSLEYIIDPLDDTRDRV